MKNVKSIFKISTITAILFLLLSPVYSLNNEVKDGFEKTFKVSATDKLVLNMYDSDLQINTWSNSEIKLTAEILVSGGVKEDVDKLIEAFKNPEVSQGSGQIEINTSFIESSSTFSLFGLSKVSKIKLSTGGTVSVDAVKASYAIWVPESIAIKLISKYNNIKASDLKGSLDFQLYNVDAEMSNFGDKSAFDLKYSTLNAVKGKDVKLILYDSKVVVDELNKVILESKYSNVTGRSINLLVAESYSDNFSIDNLNGIDINAKYTTLKAKGNSNIGKYNLYDCNITVENFTKIDFDSKYSEFSANRVGTFNIKTSYNDSYNVNEISDLFCQEAKYNKMSIGTVLTSINLPDTYDSDIKVSKVSTDFISFKGNFKYGSVTLATDPTFNFRLICENTYGEISYPKERFSNKPLIYIEKDNKTQIECSTDPNAKCEINFTAYDMNFTIE